MKFTKDDFKTLLIVIVGGVAAHIAYESDFVQDLM